MMVERSPPRLERMRRRVERVAALSCKSVVFVFFTHTFNNNNNSSSSNYYHSHTSHTNFFISLLPLSSFLLCPFFSSSSSSSSSPFRPPDDGPLPLFYSQRHTRTKLLPAPKENS
mmetsp:Transcript_8883/g.15113  ORF Transcript_8883/g.15113 Transcript_8883/m.15113 type:complete len:115 (-) Transcript_8883:345-689(-)